MALKATVFKATLQIANMDKHHYQDYNLTLARHPSETDERMMVRLLAFALHADEALSFANGICVEDEPDLWQKDYTGAIANWINVGLPDEKLIRRACGRADQVAVYNYGGRVADMWWEQSSDKLAKLRNLAVYNLPPDTTRALAKLAERNMTLNFTMQEGQIWLSNASDTAEVELLTVKANSV
ncbi:MAG: YaeQ family protein [Sulfuriferula sp.]|nr:YaeQ family protein [Sulfuriferula sp.]